MRRSLLLLALPAVVSLQPSVAHAWNSTCRTYPDPTLDTVDLAKLTGAKCADSPLVGATVGEPGPWTAQGRYRSDDGQDEHSAIFRRVVQLAGIPARVLDTQHVTVFAFDKPASSIAGTLGAATKSIAPVSFTNTTLARHRAFAVDELAMLPDFSYSLWDWASGNETCPLSGYEGDGAIACHAFESHMGMANANHFPPQADRTYERLHKIAVDRAKQCAAVRVKIPAAERPRHRVYLEACEIESLAVEAVAQHYLQDTWSTGHMWERWGTADVDRYPDPGFELFDGTTTALDRRRYTARVVGAIAGIVHGMEPAFGNQDAMCYPYPEISFWPAMSSTPIRGAGDVHLADFVRVNPDFTTQDVKLMSCGAASVREVYDALGADPAHGPASGTLTSTLAGCVGHRVTNTAYDRGVGIDAAGVSGGTWVGLAAVLFPFSTAVVATGAAAAISSGWKLGLTSVGASRMHEDLVQLSYVAEMRAKDAGSANDMSTLDVSLGGLPVQPTIFGVARNSKYLDASLPLAKYQDPGLPWPASTDTLTPDAVGRSATLANFFHRSHAADYCSMGTPALDTLKLNVAGATTASETEAKCKVCTEIVSRHLRVGTGPSSYDTRAEPVCKHLGDASTGYVYQQASGTIAGPRALARKWCGCSGAAAITDKGWFDLDLIGATVSRSSDPPIASTPAGTQPRDAAITGDGRAIVTHSDGTLVFLDLASRRELDTDDDPTTTTPGAPAGVTRLKPSTATRGVAIAERTGKQFALVVSQGSDELVVVDVSADLKKPSVCKRFNIGRDSAKNEDAWDVVVMPDQTKAYVSFRGTVSAPSDTLAVIDVTKATDCATAGGEVTKYLSAIFGSKAGIGSMALDPTAKRLALTARRAGTCTATVRTTKFGSTTMDIAVGCDSVILLDTTTDAVVSVPTTTGFFGTLPTFYPYALAWTPDGKLAYGMFQGPDPWPMYPGVTSVGLGGAVRLGDPAVGQSYNVALKGTIIGETLIATKDYLYVGTTSGDVTALPLTTAFWNDLKADPETTLHGTSWYGGCTDGTAGVPSPKACPTAASLGSPIRVMIQN